MKVLITGASSLPGYKLVLEGVKRGYSIVATYHRVKPPIPDIPEIKLIKTDLTLYTNAHDIVAKHMPKAIIHAAAYGDVDGCEKDREYAWKANYLSTSYISQIAEIFNIHIIYLSTDYVFDGSKGNYSERDIPSPINYYGLTKLLGEVSVANRGCRWTIVRTSSIYGLGPGRVNFAKYLINKLSRGEQVKALVDQYTSPTHAGLLAKAIWEIVENGYSGLIHIAGERMSRYQFAKTVAERLGFDPSLVVEAYERDFKWVAPRPRDSSLDCDRARGVLKVDFYSTDRAMEVLREEYRSLGS